MDTARAARHRSSRVGRRAEARPKTSRCLKEKEIKGDGGTFGPAFSPIVDAPQAPEITGGEAEFAASDSYRGRHDNHAWCR
jgi:hypothetical protein